MKHVSALLILSFIVACGGGGNSSSPRQEEEVNRGTRCGGSSQMKFLCMSPIEFILNTRLTNLPKNMRITATYDIDTTETYTSVAVDTCKMPGSVEIVTNATGSSIFFQGFKLYGKDSVIEVIDLGDDCKGSTPLIKADVKREDMREERTSTSLIISIDLD